VSQTLLAVPMWVLFEVGVLFSRFYAPRAEEEQGGEAQTAGAPGGGDAGYTPMSEDEMDAELDRVDDEMRHFHGDDDGDGESSGRRDE
ncbi:MAG: hypothetical protein GWO16_13760, partial [Gammaproteobacteria bacterium]|nr:hypothetical protein [Gammaproteobacteria bacterium]NIR32018.1 hypothetical protein [Gammaproteobacteria bacterium]NIR98987.1 hypothetical protein [Gammaproteobacteria bacterium]NIT64955.1 hypothetical protein [Gammaproteobacteria bacterium]NIV21847.1 hypothetical protein [Gammaproteobacteria bacterium]